MTVDIEQWVRGEDAAWAARDIERILSFYDEECFYEDIAVRKYIHGHASIREYLNEVFIGIPDFRVEITSFFGCATQVCTQGVMRGTHTGNIVGLPPPTCRTFSARYAHICELRRGLAVRVTDYYDMVSVLRQLGLLLHWAVLHGQLKIIF